jgi:uncharacterized protein (TIGR02302 family)
MTRWFRASEFPAGSSRALRAVFVARLLLGLERFWPLLWPASGLVGLFLALALFGAFAALPWALHALVLAAFVTAIALSLARDLEGLAWPRWEEGARKLERDSRLAHRPISEAEDILAAGAGNPFAEELWRAHLLTKLQKLGRLRLALPRPSLKTRDPRGFRFIVLALLVLGAVLARGDWRERLADAFGPAGPGPSLDAWVDPPEYTQLPPIYLTADMRRIAVPQGSVLHLRVHGSDHVPYASLGGAHFAGGQGEYVADAAIGNKGRLSVRADGRTIAGWDVAIIPDTPPTIAFTAPPARTDRDAIKLSYKADDDYGVVSARAIIRPHGRPGAPLIVDLPVPAVKGTAQTVFRDLTEHPYAGLDVDITLEDTDAAGQKGTSNTLRFKLPARQFTDPLARALIEQRQALSLGAGTRPRVLLTLDALAIAPDQFYAGKDNVYLALRAAYFGLGYARNDADIQRIQDLLWQMAVSQEQGGILDMAEQLRLMQQLLTQMIAEGAPEDEIDALLQRYNDLMQRYLSAMAQNAPQNNSPPDPGAKTIDQQDLAALLKAIQDLMQSGDREKAMQLLAFLQNLIENMQVAGGEGGQGNSANDQALRDLGDLMGRQRSLMDKTFRQSQGLGDPKDGGAKGLSNQQRQLRGDLDKMLKGAPAGNDLGRAEGLMDEAQEALGLGDFPRAGSLQKEILDALRKGADAMAGTEGKGSDPFGREAGARGASQGGNLQIPDAQVLQRARDILLELRKRAGEQGRPKEELDYIDRLLKQF